MTCDDGPYRTEYLTKHTKESDVSSDPEQSRLPADALDAYLDGLLAELREPSDPDALHEIRKAFRKRVPFSLRSAAAAVLILRAAGFPRSARPQAPKPVPGKTKPAPKAAPVKAAKREKAAGPAPKSARGDAVPRARLKGEGVTIFFSMGKRQRIFPRTLIDLILEKGGVALEDIGEVRAFDNYSFADIAPNKASNLVAALDGTDLRGRKLSVSLAKRRDESAT